MTSSYGEIVERLEKLTGPSYALEVDIGHAVGYPVELLQPPPNFTYSVDAAISLISKLLPDWSCGFDVGSKTCIAFVDPHDYADRIFGVRHTTHASTPAIALLIALFRALTVNENG